jgi:hypothetical protein
MDWKGQLAIAIGIFAIIAVVVVYVILAMSNRLPLRSDSLMDTENHVLNLSMREFLNIVLYI